MNTITKGALIGAGVSGIGGAFHPRNKGKRLKAGLRSAVPGAALGAFVGSIPHTVSATQRAAHQATRGENLRPLAKKAVTPFSAKPLKHKIEVIDGQDLGVDDVSHLLKNQGKMKNAHISIDSFIDELNKIGW